MIKDGDRSLTIMISKEYLTAKLHDHSTHIDGEKSLDKFLADNQGTIDKSKVILINEKNGSVERFKEVLEALKKRDIFKFKLVSQ